VPDAEFFEERVQIVLPSLPVRLDDLQDGADVLLHRQPAEDRCLLGQVADAEAGALVHRKARHVVPVDLDRSGVDADQPGDHVEDGGLARAVRSEEADGFAAAKRQRNVLHNHPALEGAPQAPCHEPILGAVLARCFDDFVIVIPGRWRSPQRVQCAQFGQLQR
jgi:hypothetical protein